MIFRVLLAFMLLVTGSLHGQMIELIHDTFDDNRYGWSTGNWFDNSAIIQHGKFEITKQGPNGKLFTLSRYLDPAQDFTLQASFIHSAIANNAGAGIVWGHFYANNNDNYFLFTSDGYYKIQTDDHQREDVGQWHKTTAINPVGKTNILKIEQKKGRQYFYINNQLLVDIKPLPWFDKNFGIITFANEKLLVDDFILKANQKINLPTNLAKGVVKKNLGQTINTSYSEVGPLISADGKTLFFGRKHHPGNIGGVHDNQDIWYSTSSNQSEWTQAANLGSPINSIHTDNLTAISADQNTLVFFVHDKATKKQDFAYRTRTSIGWSDLKHFGLKIDNESEYQESCLSSDGQVFLFTAKMKQNVRYRKEYDERDIYACIKKNGGWSVPINLGLIVNTPGDELSPFLAADGRTLYFASDGRPGYGNADIYMTKRIGNGWNNWTEPVNLGPEINTLNFDAYYTVPASGHFAYMATHHNSLGLSDIVQVKLPESIKPDPVVLISGRTLNAKTKEPISADIIFEDLKTRQAIGEALSSPKTGTYHIVLPYGKNYGFHAHTRGFLSVNENLELATAKAYAEVKRDLLLVPISVGETLPLNNLFFEKGKASLLPESYPELDRLVQILKDNGGIHIELAGHTDNIGRLEDLLSLSQNRVTTVKEYLVKNGIAASRIEGRGYGPAHPIEKNDTEENRLKNRRVEFKITKV
jgi:outer membrane protein OmpA-like peptidoglycan-associated protein